MKKSPIVYAGSKRRLLKQILPLLPENVNTFIDLFCGSCTVGINAVAKRLVFCDKNEPLIGIYKEFLKELKTISCEFECITFDKCFKERIRTEDFVYADPPYLITNANYNDKTRGYGGWDENDERLLLELLLKHHKNCGKFALSNVFYHKGRENKILKEWCEENNFYVDYLNMDYTTCIYTIAKKWNKEKTVEVLIRNYD